MNPIVRARHAVPLQLINHFHCFRVSRRIMTTSQKFTIGKLNTTFGQCNSETCRCCARNSASPRLFTKFCLHLFSDLNCIAQNCTRNQTQGLLSRKSPGFRNTFQLKFISSCPTLLKRKIPSPPERNTPGTTRSTTGQKTHKYRRPERERSRTEQVSRA